MVTITTAKLHHTKLICGYFCRLIFLILAASVLVFKLLQLNPLESSRTKPLSLDIVDKRHGTVNITALNMLTQIHEYYKNLSENSTLSSGLNSTQDTKMYFPRSLDIEKIQEYIQEYNSFQTILNENTFGPLENDSLVIVIQVHNRLSYLKHTITSLAQSEGIENTLLVFSHDYYDEEMNYNIQTINFCKVMQIFYPYSIQTHPNRFPGQSPNDCPQKISKNDAIDKKCNNALHPDLYGHYRTANSTQAKHHWWWKTNRIFDGLNVTKYYTGLIVFLEEDDYLVPDFIHVLHLMENLKQSECPECRILSLGPHTMNVNFSEDASKAITFQWVSHSNNLGLAFKRPVWEELKKCAKVFCTYDDYNWDWTLTALSNKCIPNKVTAMVLTAPRAFHIGDCGMHHINKNCRSLETLKKIRKLVLKSSRHFFPERLLLRRMKPTEFQPEPVPNGGWGDIRDHNLCLNMSQTIEL